MSGVTTATVLAGVGLAATAATTAYTLFGNPGTKVGGGQMQLPDPGTPPAPPKLEDPSIAAASAAQAAAAANAKGRASTILTSGLGDETAVTTNKKTLLGS